MSRVQAEGVVRRRQACAGTVADEPVTVFSVYIVRCADNSYYTGIAADVERRIDEHRRSSRGAKYLKGRGPLTLVFSEVVGDRAAASRVEYRMKKLSRAEKQDLVEGRARLSVLLPDQGSDAGCA
ncbi:MAG TPA: GIY-YIG nuclease family protein [Woeseiaceae bacterium]|nr:GIY-YIG nuclease family protein [Woeseiaceae bacterium]